MRYNLQRVVRNSKLNWWKEKVLWFFLFGAPFLHITFTYSKIGPTTHWDYKHLVVLRNVNWLNHVNILLRSCRNFILFNSQFNPIRSNRVEYTKSSFKANEKKNKEKCVHWTSLPIVLTWKLLKMNVLWTITVFEPYLLWMTSLSVCLFSFPFYNGMKWEWRTHKLFSQFMFHVCYTHIESHTRYKFAKCECVKIRLKQKWYFYVFEFNGPLIKISLEVANQVCLSNVYSWTWMNRCRIYFYWFGSFQITFNLIYKRRGVNTWINSNF